MSGFLIAIDQGTTSSRAILFDSKGNVQWTAQQEFQQFYPQDGWVEHDPEEIWQTALNVCRDVIQQGDISADKIISAGITNQRETTLVWDATTGEAIYPAIVWQDRRTADYCSTLKAQGREAEVSQKTGLLIDPYFSATKIKWILDNVPGAREKAEQGQLRFGTVDTFLLWRLTDGKVHKTDATNASRTLLFNIHEQTWDSALLDLFEIPANMLPQVEDCAHDFGRIHEKWLGKPVAIGAIAGDQQAALIGQACFQPGMVKSTYGTGCFMILNTGEQVVTSQNRLLTTIGYRLNGKVTYAVEGSIFIAGAAIQWLRDGLRLIPHASVTESLANEAKQSHVYMVPAFTGLGAPYWDPNARGAIFGLNRDTGIADVVAAGLQSVCYQTKDLLEAMKADGAATPSALRVDGGMVVNHFVVQSLSDILGVTVERPEVTETTALGVAYLAGLQAGVYQSLEEISKLWCHEASFQPSISEAQRKTLYNGWLEAVERVRSKVER